MFLNNVTMDVNPTSSKEISCDMSDILYFLPNLITQDSESLNPWNTIITYVNIGTVRSDKGWSLDTAYDQLEKEFHW